MIAECPAIPGCVSQGQTEAEAIANCNADDSPPAEEGGAGVALEGDVDVEGGELVVGPEGPVGGVDGGDELEGAAGVAAFEVAGAGVDVVGVDVPGDGGGGGGVVDVEDGAGRHGDLALEDDALGQG